MIKNQNVDWDNCSSILVGKNASKTGYVLMAHGEDDLNCISQLHKVPRMQHKEGEVLTFADGTAVIPQVPETYAYIWSEFRSIGGEPFADGFVNEWGVSVATNSCVSTKESKEDHKEGIGYGMRRLIAERSRTAREGVQVVAQLMRDFGYRSTRSYHICDKDEAWVVQLTVGSNFVAQRVGDDEIYYIPNWLTIHNVDFSDTEHKNFYWSEDLVGYAMRNGWYTPAKEGDYSDFDYAAVYQGDNSEAKSNFDRSDLAWKQITGDKPMPYRTFSIKAPKKFGVDDLKKILRSHYMEHEEDLKEDPQMSPHRYGICRDTTVESLVVEFAEDPNLTVLWRAFPRPCVSPFLPWFVGMTKSPKGYSWLGVKSSQVSHLDPDEDEFKYHGDRAYWAFHKLMNTMEFDYQYGQEMVHSSIEKMEKAWAVTVPAIKETYLKLKETDEDIAKEYLTDWTHAQAQKAWDWADQMCLDLVNKKNADNATFWRSKL